MNNLTSISTLKGKRTEKMKKKKERKKLFRSTITVANNTANSSHKASFCPFPVCNTQSLITTMKTVNTPLWGRRFIKWNLTSTPPISTWRDKALSITTNQVSQMPCIRFKSHTHTHTHTHPTRERERRET